MYCVQITYVLFVGYRKYELLLCCVLVARLHAELQVLDSLAPGYRQRHNIEVSRQGRSPMQFPLHLGRSH